MSTLIFFQPPPADYPSPLDVRLGTGYDGGDLVGLLDLPSAANVRDGVTFDIGRMTGSMDLPAPENVRDGVLYDNGQQAGTYAVNLLPPAPLTNPHVALFPAPLTGVRHA